VSRDPILIGLCGHAGSGKTAAADHLHIEHSFEQLAFADGLKDMLADHFNDLGVDYACLHEPGLKNEPLHIGQAVTSARELMQRLGDTFRAVHADWWVHALAMRAGMAGPRDQWQPIHDRIVITDIRYPNEAAWLLQAGGILIRLQREGAPPVREHGSERHVSRLPAHITLVNNGPTMHGLHTLLDGAVADVLARAGAAA